MSVPRDDRVAGECVRDEGSEMPRWGSDYWPRCKKDREELDEYDAQRPPYILDLFPSLETLIY